jgi:hypothetical protein
VVSSNCVDSDKLAGFEISPEVYSLGLAIFILGSGDIWNNCIIVWSIGFVGRRLEP